MPFGAFWSKLEIGMDCICLKPSRWTKLKTKGMKMKNKEFTFITNTTMHPHILSPSLPCKTPSLHHNPLLPCITPSITVTFHMQPSCQSTCTPILYHCSHMHIPLHHFRFPPSTKNHSLIIYTLIIQPHSHITHSPLCHASTFVQALPHNLPSFIQKMHSLPWLTCTSHYLSFQPNHMHSHMHFHPHTPIIIQHMHP